jgi:hypothetical protein
MPTYTVGKGPYRKGAIKGDETEEFEDTPDLDCLRRCIQDSQSDAAWFLDRNRVAFNAWHSRWPYQTADGRKWRNDGMQESDLIWPWEGACDTRVRTCDKIIREHMTVASFAWMNMKVQAKSTRPFSTLRESQQATALLNWMLFTKMQPQFGRELALALNWRFALGACAIEIMWDQERRIDHVEVTVVQLADMLSQYSGQEVPIEDVSMLIANDDYEETLIHLIQQISPIVSRPDAKNIIKDLRQIRYATIPVPYVYVSQPRWTGLRLMLDLLIPAQTDTIQRARWVDRIEWVTETELSDRITTQGYDPDFVDEAIARKGKTPSTPLFSRADQAAPIMGGPIYIYGTRQDDFDDRIELHHFWQKGHDKGVPCLYVTTFHMEIPDNYAKYGPCEYAHGQYPFIEMRNEYHERPILTSRGIPEIAYTWENEIKAQRDGRTDRTDLSLRPPLLAPYQDVQRIKAQFEPGVIYPERREGSMRFMPINDVDSSSVQIENAVKLDIAEFFGLFGAELDPALKQQRQMELADAVLEEVKPGIDQTFKLMQQYLPDKQVVAVVGELARPGILSQVSRENIQGGYEIAGTADMRELDKDWLKEKAVMVQGIMNMDRMGVIDANTVIQNMMGAVDYNLAEMAIKDTGVATQQERDDEINKISQIIGSGLDMPLPQSGNFQLRLQTLQSTMQDALQNNPATRKQIQQNPDIMKVIQKRAEYYQNQLQQQQNAQIGRSLATRTFTKQAPQLAAPPGPAMTPAMGPPGMGQQGMPQNAPSDGMGY